ncbi:hypothetical protein WJ971_09355 [Achromobacter xylosoxidans]
MNSSQPGTGSTVPCRMTLPGWMRRAVPPSKPRPNWPCSTIATPTLDSAAPLAAQSDSGRPSRQPIEMPPGSSCWERILSQSGGSRRSRSCTLSGAPRSGARRG